MSSATTASPKTARKYVWARVGICWLVLLVVFSVIAKIVDKSGASASTIEDVAPGFQVPIISFPILKSDRVLNSDELDEFIKNVKEHPQYRLVIVGHASGDSPEDRQIATERANFVTRRLAESGLSNQVISNGVAQIANEAIKGVTFKVKELKQRGTN